MNGMKSMDAIEAPKDLHALEYARHILSEILGWPDKGNLELMSDCLKAIQSSRKLATSWHAHKYMLRAIELARSQGIVLDRMWLMNGEYTNVRPERKEFKGSYEPIDAERTRQEQEKPEWQEASRKIRERLRELAGMKGMPASTSGRDVITAQAKEIAARSQKRSGATKIRDTEPSR